jgi:1-acyl-sn-glycerol-3-phosphate acyltransferase
VLVTEGDNEYGHLRGYVRLVGFVLRLLWTGVRLLVLRPQTLMERGLWKQQMCLLIARGMGLTIDVTGRVPATGMIVSNHLSYLDAVVLGALTPAVFVAKQEVRSWPLVGWLTAGGGTIYLKRENVRAAVDVNRKLASAIEQNVPIVIFPEGTTTGATDPLPFHPALFEPAQRSGAAVWPASLVYTINSGSEGVAEKVCYWGDMTFMPHLLLLMRQRNLGATVCVADEPVFAPTRNELAVKSHTAVTEMFREGARVPLRVAARSVEGQQATSLQPLQN